MKIDFSVYFKNTNQVFLDLKIDFSEYLKKFSE